MQISEFLMQLRFELTRLHFNRMVEICEMLFKREKLSLRPESVSESKGEVKLLTTLTTEHEHHMIEWEISLFLHILFPPLIFF